MNVRVLRSPLNEREKQKLRPEEETGAPGPAARRVTPSRGVMARADPT